MSQIAPTGINNNCRCQPTRIIVGNRELSVHTLLTCGHQWEIGISVSFFSLITHGKHHRWKLQEYLRHCWLPNLPDCTSTRWLTVWCHAMLCYVTLCPQSSTLTTTNNCFPSHCWQSIFYAFADVGGSPLRLLPLFTTMGFSTWWHPNMTESGGKFKLAQ